MIINLPWSMQQTVGKWVKSWKPELVDELSGLISKNVPMDDARLLRHISEKIIPPATHSSIKFSRYAMATPQINEVLHITNTKVRVSPNVRQ